MTREVVQQASGVAAVDLPAPLGLDEGSARIRPLYFVNAWLDAAVIGGLSIAVFAASMCIPAGYARTEAIKLGAVLSLFINYPHFSATNYRLYQNIENIRQFPVTALVLPFVIVCLVATALWQPTVLAPYLITLYLLWSPFHYSGQTMGITMIYARRAEFDLGRRGRSTISAFVFATFIVSVIHRQPREAQEIFGISLPPIPFPVWFDAVLTAGMYAAAAGLALLVVACYRRHHRLIPPIVLLPAAAQFIWFIVGVQADIFYIFVPLFHSLQYLYIAWAMQMSLRRTGPRHGPHALSIGAETLRWGVSNYIGGVGLFIVLPLLVRWVDQPFLVVTGIVIAGVNIHHFFVDGVIWKLRDKSITSALMVNIGDLAAPRRSGA